MATRRYPTEAEKKELSDLWFQSHAYREGSYKRMQWVTDRFAKLHPEWTHGSASKALEDTISHQPLGRQRRRTRM